MLSKKEIVCPENLLRCAKSKGVAKAVIVNAGKAVVMESVKQAVDSNLIEPVFVGDKTIINKCASDLKWDVSKYEIINEVDENSFKKRFKFNRKKKTESCLAYDIRQKR